MEKEELIVTNIEETPLSQGETLTSLREKYLISGGRVEEQKRKGPLYAGAMGVGALCLIAAFANMYNDGNVDTFGAITSVLGIGFGMGGLTEFMVNYSENYGLQHEFDGREYYAALKEEAIKRGFKKDIEKKSISDLEEVLGLKEEDNPKDEEKGFHI